MKRNITVYELIQSLSQFKPDDEVVILHVTPKSVLTRARRIISVTRRVARPRIEILSEWEEQEES